MKIKLTYAFLSISLLFSILLYGNDTVFSYSASALEAIVETLSPKEENRFENSKEIATLNVAGCDVVQLPFIEGFEDVSATKDCWTILDVNNDGTTNTNNKWRRYTSQANAVDGMNSMFFNGNNTGLPHNDLLVTPKLSLLDTEMYQLTYYYKTSASANTEFEVILSDVGTGDVTVLQDKAVHKTGAYTKKVIYIEQIKGTITIAWKVLSTGASPLYIDKVSLEKVGCKSPEGDASLDDVEKDNATFSWTDDLNTKWEYVVQLPTGTAPGGSGVISDNPFVTVKRISGTTTDLEPNTEYEFYVRSTCGQGKVSAWVGPLVFRTLCDIQPIPFYEGFNKEESLTLDCWTIIDANNDSTNPNSNIWTITTSQKYEGSNAMLFKGSSNKVPHDDWLISPIFTLDVTKKYRVKYHYRTNMSYSTDFKLMLSKEGANVEGFKEELLFKDNQGDNTWKEEILILANISGTINLGWHVISTGVSTELYIDNFSIEEIAGCAEPLNLGVKDMQQTSGTLFWQDDFGSAWEYYVQPESGKRPVGLGEPTSTKENIVTKDHLGKALEAGVRYEFYVRTVCEDDTKSIWAGPFAFRTACGVFKTPFWEGFNYDSETWACWEIIDGNEDSTSPDGNNIWRRLNYGQFEGSHQMQFFGLNNDVAKLPHNDWLISPTITFEAAKTYRLKYHYKLAMGTTRDYEFEVLISNEGIEENAFKKAVVAKKKYEQSDVWTEEYVFITGISGDVNIAWHITAATPQTYLYLDNIFIEEVEGCPEPLNLQVDNIEKSSATIGWEDGYNATTWEYYVQEKGKGVPTSSGTSTKNKQNDISKDAENNNLEPNTEYEFYVRTVCGNGVFSMWSGPYSFITACWVFETPFWESFNKDSKPSRCWININKNDQIVPIGSIWKYTTDVYEGDQALTTTQTSPNKEPIDDWLISPTVIMDGGMYVLKYHYKTSGSTIYNNDFGVLLSNDGIDKDKFTTTVATSKNHKSSTYSEQVSFIEGFTGEVNLAWHMNAVNTNYSYLTLDNVYLKKVENCPEPYYVKVSNIESTSLDVEWEQTHGITNWEVLVVPYGEDETGVPIQKVPVTGNPKVTLNGLPEGTALVIYVRAICSDAKTFSDWSTPVKTATKVGGNNDCSGAITIPVNNGVECVLKVNGSLFGAAKSTLERPTCTGMGTMEYDAWFSFVATATTLQLTVDDIVGMATSKASSIEVAVYEDACGAMTNTVIDCYRFTATDQNKILFNLIVGRTYYLRFGSGSATTDTLFSACLTSTEFSPIDVSPVGDKYSLDELIKDIFIQSECDLVSNVTYQNGDGGPRSRQFNTLGYFKNNKSDFPFEEGIVLSTNEVKYVPGPFWGLQSFRGSNNERWVGDNDINDAISDAGGGITTDKRVTQVEFEFTPIKDEIQFEYLFASNSYHRLCGVTCVNGAMFAAWLIDTTTGDGQNLAKVPGTDKPISINTIRDSSKSGTTCASTNAEWFGKYYDNKDSALEAPADFVGFTKPMSSEVTKVVPGRKYRIKLAVIDFCDAVQHSSAVFFNAASFDIVSLDMGEDLLVDNGTALCDSEIRTIYSGLGNEGVVIEWYKDDVLIKNETSASLEVSESGKYKVVGKYPEIKCETSGEIYVEIFPAISTVVHRPGTVRICKLSLEEMFVDLTDVEEEMYRDTDGSNFITTYYESEDDAENDVNRIENIHSYPLGFEHSDKRFYIRVVNTRTDCHEVFYYDIIGEKGLAPAARGDVKVCASYVLPALESNQYYYTESSANGIEYKAGEVLDQIGEHTIYVLQKNGSEGCYEEISYKIAITEAVVADVLPDDTIDCQLFVLQDLSINNKYFTEPGGRGVELLPGTVIRPIHGALSENTRTIYIYIRSEDGLCEDESKFTITFEDCPIQKGISPNGDGYNDAFDLTPHGVMDLKIYNRYGSEVYSYGVGYTTEWVGQDKNGNALPDGTYYYVVISNGKTRTGWVQINK